MTHPSRLLVLIAVISVGLVAAISDSPTLVLIAVISIGIVAWITNILFETEEEKRQRAEAIRTLRENVPELAALRNAVTALRDFVARANAYRPSFSFPFDVLFPRDCEGSGDGPDPEPWVTTVGNLLVPEAHELRSIYTNCMNSFDPPVPPEYPQVELPLPDIKIAAGRKFLIRLRKLYTRKPSQTEKLQEAANQLQHETAEQRRKAEEAKFSEEEL